MTTLTKMELPTNTDLIQISHHYLHHFLKQITQTHDIRQQYVRPTGYIERIWYIQAQRALHLCDDKKKISLSFT